MSLKARPHENRHRRRIPGFVYRPQGLLGPSSCSSAPSSAPTASSVVGDPDLVGAETTSAYKAGQLYNGELARAREQTPRLGISPDGRARARRRLRVRVTAQDASGAPLAGERLVAILQRPTDKRADR